MCLFLFIRIFAKKGDASNACHHAPTQPSPHEILDFLQTFRWPRSPTRSPQDTVGKQSPKVPKSQGPISISASHIPITRPCHRCRLWNIWKWRFCKVQIGAKGRKNEPGLVASKDMGNNCACRWTIHENSGCNVSTFAIPIGPHRVPSGPIASRNPTSVGSSATIHSLRRCTLDHLHVIRLYPGPTVVKTWSSPRLCPALHKMSIWPSNASQMLAAKTLNLWTRSLCNAAQQLLILMQNLCKGPNEIW